MQKNYCYSFYCVFLLYFFVFGHNIYAQADSIKIAKPLTGIGDTVSVNDSTQQTTIKKPFLLKSLDTSYTASKYEYHLSKKAIDFSDYRYSGNLIQMLPFGNLHDFGSLGTPSEVNIYSFGNGNISLFINENSLINKLNNSIDLNRIQVENISSISVLPIHKSFLLGFENNLAAISIKTNDTLKSKPISRIRFYQASSEEGFIDAFFSARVLSKLALSLRLTNSSINKNYDNTEFGTWKFNTKAIYKIDDSLFASLDFYHLKLNTPLNGGVDVRSVIQSSTDASSDIFTNTAPVLFNEMKNTTTLNKISTKFYGYFLPGGKTDFVTTYTYNKDVFEQEFTDTTDIKNENLYEGIDFQLFHKINSELFFADISLGYQSVNFNADSHIAAKDLISYYSTLTLTKSFFDDIFTTSIFGKISEYENQKNSGYGIDLSTQPSNYFRFFFGHSNFYKPLTYFEKESIGDVDQKHFNIFGGFEFKNSFLTNSVSYFYTKSENTPIPIYNTEDIQNFESEIVFTKTGKLVQSGINVLANLKFWKLLATINFNLYWQSENSYFPKEAEYNLNAGIYYVDTLYNSNLDLKTGFNFYYSDNLEYRAYDFQKMRSASYYLQNDNFNKFQNYLSGNNPIRLDFFLAGRIQDSATFYFVYENLLGNNYFIVPYYPMPEGGMRIGISWDFLD